MKHSEHSDPGLRRRLVSSANWGMLAGFWVELPLLTAFLFKPKAHADWHKLNAWSVRAVLPATLAGVIYGWMKPEKECAEPLPPVAEPTLPADSACKTYWAQTEVAREKSPLVRRV